MMGEPVATVVDHIPQRLRLVAFDLDGTLADTFEDIAQATNQVLSAFGCPTLPTATIKSFVGYGARNLVAKALGPGREAFVDAAAVLWRELYERHPVEQSSLYPGAVELLEWLQSCDVRTAILSNKVDSLTQQIAKALGLADRVDFVRGECAEFPRKPDPALLQHLMELYAVRPEQTLVVGDSGADLEFARNAGVAFCGVLTGQFGREDFRALDAAWLVANLEVFREQLDASGACRP
jgi:phosphoglycolate phosphatase